MRTSAAIALLMMAVVVGACGSTAPVAPSPTPSTPPSPAPPQLPSLVGEWRSLGDVTFEERDGWRGSYSCPGSWSIQSQSGGEFSGRAGWQGNGFNGDRYCAYSGAVSGVINPDGTLIVRLDPIFKTRCSQIAGDGTLTGRMNADGTATVQTSADATCIHDPLGHPTSVVRTFTMTISRR